MARFRYNKKKNRHRGKYKSGLENNFATLAVKAGLGFSYEPDRIAYIRPSHYLPDWKIGTNVYIETKGYFSPSHRANLLSFREQHASIRILLLFGNSQNKLHAGSRTTYAEWCDKHGFEHWDIRKGLPLHWWEKYAN